jgi:hypothetical protein
VSAPNPVAVSDPSINIERVPGACGSRGSAGAAATAIAAGAGLGGKQQEPANVHVTFSWEGGAGGAAAVPACNLARVSRGSPCRATAPQGTGRPPGKGAWPLEEHQGQRHASRRCRLPGAHSLLSHEIVLAWCRLWPHGATLAQERPVAAALSLRCLSFCSAVQQRPPKLPVSRTAPQRWDVPCWGRSDADSPRTPMAGRD